MRKTYQTWWQLPPHWTGHSWLSVDIWVCYKEERMKKKHSRCSKKTKAINKTKLQILQRDINGRTDPSVTSEFACNLAGGNIPQDHSLIGAAGANLAVVIGTVKVASEEHSMLLCCKVQRRFQSTFSVSCLSSSNYKSQSFMTHLDRILHCQKYSLTCLDFHS